MSYESFHSRAGDYFGTCPVSGKRGYTSRKQARKARQGGAHVHGNPYKCRHCQLWHLGRYHNAKTRDEYRGDTTGMIHTDQVCAELSISYHVLNQALRHLDLRPENHHIPEYAFEQLRKLAGRKE